MFFGWVGSRLQIAFHGFVRGRRFYVLYRTDCSLRGSQKNISGFTDASLTSTTHALTLWDTGGLNIIADNNEIMARNNGTTANLHLNTDWGSVFVHYNAPVATRFVIRDDGNVGIGTSAPTSKLQIGSNTPNAANYITFGERVSSAESNLPFIGQTNITGTEQSLWLWSRSTGGWIGFFAGPSTPFFNNNLLRMFISPSGNVGIGTNAPAEALHVVGEVQLNREWSIYDVWIQWEGPVGSTRPRNLALLWVEGSDRLYLNFNNEYSWGTNVGSVHFRTTEIDNVTCVWNCF